MIRTINHIVVHCSGVSQDATIEAIKAYWKNVMGWTKPGYHYYIQKHGTILELAPIQEIVNGVAGHNADSIHICYAGGVNKYGQPVDNRTPGQNDSLEQLVKDFHRRFPQAKILGHCEFPAVVKTCPNFDVQNWLKIEKII